MDINIITEFISNNGLPIFIVLCFLYILFYFWKFVTKLLKPELLEILEVLDKLDTNVRTVENDAEKLNQKVSIITVVKKDYASKI